MIVTAGWLSDAVENIWGKELKQQVIDSGAIVVIRPDSGDPTEVVSTIAKQLDEAYGSNENDKGYKVLNNVRIIQGDGIDSPETLDSILSELARNGYSADNVAFGMGGGSLQQVNRDTYKFAMKCSAVRIDGEWTDVYKNPVGAPWKASKGGRVTNDGMRTVYFNGQLLVDETFGLVRDRAKAVRLR